MELKDADVVVLIVHFTVVIFFVVLGMKNTYNNNFQNLN